VTAEANEPMYAIDKKVDADLLPRKGVALFGTLAVVGEAISRSEQCGYEDFMFHAWFETAVRGEEIETQMQLRRRRDAGASRWCGGQMKNPEVGVDFTAHAQL
jgi:hypothetical protein